MIFHRFLPALFLTLPLFSLVEQAGAACKPYQFDPAFLADVQKDDFHRPIRPV